MYERFAWLAQRKGVTPYRVAKETGIGQATLSDWKRGRCVPKADKLRLLADYFGVSMETLMEPDDTLTGSLETAASKSPSLTGTTGASACEEAAPGEPICLDAQTLELLDSLRTRPEMKMLFSLTAKATRADVLKAVRIIEALQDQQDGES